MKKKKLTEGQRLLVNLVAELGKRADAGDKRALSTLKKALTPLGLELRRIPQKERTVQ